MPLKNIMISHKKEKVFNNKCWIKCIIVNVYYFFFLMAYHNILHWNCRGIQANVNELEIIANDFNIGIFCLQETLLSPNKQITFKHYTAYHNFSNNISDTHPFGGVTILVHNSIPNSSIPHTTRGLLSKLKQLP